VEEYVCTRCKKGYSDPGHCPTHQDEPLLDTKDREVCFYLLKLDDEAANKAYMRWIMAGVGVGGLVALFFGFLLLFMAQATRSFTIHVHTAIFVAPIAAGGSAGLWLAKKRYRPTYSNYTRRVTQR
jgi:hypothetical protein